MASGTQIDFGRASIDHATDAPGNTQHESHESVAWDEDKGRAEAGDSGAVPEPVLRTPDLRMPTLVQAGAAPTEITGARVRTSVVHHRGANCVRDEYARADGAAYRSVAHIDAAQQRAVHHLIVYAEGMDGVCAVSQYTASADSPMPTLASTRTNVTRAEIHDQFGEPGAAAARLLVCPRTEVTGEPAPSPTFSVPIVFRTPGSDGGAMCCVALPVTVETDPVVRAWGGVANAATMLALANRNHKGTNSHADADADARADARANIGRDLSAPKRVGQLPASIGRAHARTSVAHTRDGESVRDDYAMVRPNVLVRSIVWSSGRDGGEAAQYILWADLLRTSVHLRKFYKRQGDNACACAMEYEETLPLFDAHARFGPPGAAASKLFAETDFAPLVNANVERAWGSAWCALRARPTEFARTTSGAVLPMGRVVPMQLDLKP